MTSTDGQGAVPDPDRPLLDGYPVRDPLLVERYNAALESITDRRTRLTAFDLDAHGYSPQIARELEDPWYLGHGVDHPFAILLTVDQLDRPVVQPNAGFAREAIPRLSATAVGALANLTLDEAVVIEFAHPLTRIHDAVDLGALTECVLEIDTPSGRVRQAIELADRKTVFVAANHLWHDEAHIASLLKLAQGARGLAPSVPALRDLLCPVRDFHHPGFSGVYVFRDPPEGEGDLFVLAPDELSHDRPPGGLTPILLNVPNALEFLQGHGLARIDPLATDPVTGRRHLDRKIEWILIHTLLADDPDRDPDELTAPVLERTLRSSLKLHPDIIQLHQARIHLETGGRAEDMTFLTPLNRLRLLHPTDTPAADVVEHLLARLDPVDREARDRVAPDLLLAEPAPDPRLDRILRRRRPESRDGQD